MQLKEKLDGSKTYYQLKFQTKLRISKSALETLHTRPSEPNQDDIQELVDLGLVNHFSGKDGDVYTLSKYGVDIAEITASRLNLSWLKEGLKNENSSKQDDKQSID